MKSTHPRIVLIHATRVSITPVLQAFHDHWSGAETVNLLDDSLSTDLKQAGTLEGAVGDRIVALARYGVNIGADALLYTCSAFGEAIDLAREEVDIPVLKPNEAMFEEAVAAGGKVGLLTTFKPSVVSMEKEFQQLAESTHPAMRLKTVLVEQAMNLLADGDPEGHNQLLRKAAVQFSGFDTLMLAQFSTAQAADSVAEVLDCTILTSPGSAVKMLKRVLNG